MFIRGSSAFLRRSHQSPEFVSAAPLGHHELIAFRIDAHREMKRILRRVLGFARQAATAFLQPCDALAQVIELEGQAGPGALALTTAMDADGGTGNDDLAPGFRLETDRPAEELFIEAEATLVVGPPRAHTSLFRPSWQELGTNAVQAAIGIRAIWPREAFEMKFAETEHPLEAPRLPIIVANGSAHAIE